ncbi:MAG: DUF4276 family protein [Candidatus Eremiobacteraeota bacterium]|nr:DUF4276 family protein [Candidatus Eremiobacteraeota bacterium]
MKRVSSIVEGHGEERAVPALIHRVAAALGKETPHVLPPIRVRIGRFLNDETEFGEKLDLAANQTLGDGAVVVLFDNEDGCPAVDAPKLLHKMRNRRADVPITLVQAFREYETWFLYSLESLQPLLPNWTPATTVNTMRRDAKGQIAHLMGEKYEPVIHQVQLTRLLDIAAARNCDSFDKFCREMDIVL